MAEVKTEQEPSIEEILESIRQIISDDADTAVKPVTAAAPAVEPTPEVVVPLSLEPVVTTPEPVIELEVLDLTEKVDTAPAVDLRPQTLAPEPEPPAVEKMDAPTMTDTTDTLMSAQTADAVTDSLSKLVAGNIALEKEEVGRVGKVTLEDITRELMKPMIRTWLDQNLPGIIEKMVQKEIEKLSRRAGDK